MGDSARKAAGSNKRLGLSLAMCAAGMVMLAYASVPLYQLFCQVTGFGGTPQVAETSDGRILDRVITVRFNADTNPDLGWAFQPVEREIKMRVGEERLAFYRATNQTHENTMGTATFNVTPLKAGAYFSKIECFCFVEQALGPYESVEMPVSFFVDPDIANDRNMDDVKTITLSYTFFPKRDLESKRTAQLSNTAR